MLKKGMVIKIKEKYVIVATDESDFVRISKKDGLLVGQKIYFDELDIVQLTHDTSSPKHWTGRCYGAVLAACLLMMAIFINPFNIGKLPIYAVVSLDINPSFELEIDKELRVLSIRAVNEDGLEIVDQSLVGLSLDDAVKETIIDVEESGVAITKDSGILISTVILDKEKENEKREIAVVEKEIVEGLDKAFDQVPSIEEAKVVIVEADESDLENANDENLSVGKYKLIHMTEVEGSEEVLKTESIGELIKREDIIDDFVNNKNNLIIEGKDIDEINELTDEDVTKSMDEDEHWLEDYELDEDEYDEDEDELDEDELDEDELDEDELDEDELEEDELDEDELEEDELDEDELEEDELDEDELEEDELKEAELEEAELEEAELEEDELDEAELEEDELDEAESEEAELEEDESEEDELDEAESEEDELDEAESEEDESEEDESDE